MKWAQLYSSLSILSYCLSLGLEWKLTSHCWVFQICWHIECGTLTASSFRIWNSSFAVASPPPLALSSFLIATYFGYQSLYCHLLSVRNQRYHFLGLWLLLCLEASGYVTTVCFRSLFFLYPNSYSSLILLSFWLLSFSWSFLVYYSFSHIFNSFYLLKWSPWGTVSAGFYFWFLLSLTL